VQKIVDVQQMFGIERVKFNQHQLLDLVEKEVMVVQVEDITGKNQIL
jgi:hypothetical protein